MHLIRSLFLTPIAMGVALYETSVWAADGVALANIGVSLTVQQTCSIQTQLESSSPEVSCEFQQPFHIQTSQDNPAAAPNDAPLLDVTDPAAPAAGKRVWTVVF